MVVSCEDVWREISNYLDGEVAMDLRAAMDEHFRGCERCTAVLDGTRNIIQLYGDERMTEIPLGYSYRLHRRLEENMPSSRRRFLGWAVAATAAILVAGGMELGRSPRFRQPELRSEHAKPGAGVPPDMDVIVATDGKTFHRPGCQFIHDLKNARTMAVKDAVREGYTPCVRCMNKYLTA